MSTLDVAAVEALVQRVFEKLDWSAMGAIYFHEDGERLLRDRRGAIVSRGIALARELQPRLAVGGRSVWAGAGIAELPVLLAEAMLLERRVTAVNCLADECALLDAALAAAAPEAGLCYTHADLRAFELGACDHLGCISLFTDPETWPTLSGVAYGRLSPVQVDVDLFVREREDARGIADRLFAALSRPGTITTTVEEVSWFLECAGLAGCSVEAGEELIETAVVGDPVGFLAVHDD